jgi:hypothetical protein
MSVGPALSGILQETYQGTIPGVTGLFPTDHAYQLIFITASLVSLASLVLALSVSRTRITTETITSEQREPNRDYG